ncbi:MAG TPA: hypothetical protein VGS23_06455 [Thermoplasmata archaeon]|nr:hypothetical protein [Thermoplasmata archaeon]
MEEAVATADAPARRRGMWSIRRIAEDLGGRPIADFQDHGDGTHLDQYHAPVVERLPPRSGPRTAPSRGPAAPGTREDPGGASPEELDPVARIYPPLTRSTGRALHGAEREHHAETLATVRGEPAPPEPGLRPHRPGPSTRPERIYLHYLLLHLDRLGDHALEYLAHAVREELEARRAPPT